MHACGESMEEKDTEKLDFRRRSRTYRYKIVRFVERDRERERKEKTAVWKMSERWKENKKLPQGRKSSVKKRETREAQRRKLAKPTSVSHWHCSAWSQVGVEVTRYRSMESPGHCSLLSHPQHSVRNSNRSSPQPATDLHPWLRPQIKWVWDGEMEGGWAGWRRDRDGLADVHRDLSCQRRIWAVWERKQRQQSTQSDSEFI